ncbi:MAG: hypothetical protein IAE77_10090 [Prosthecobacter sp.]|uniref:hypothetical protein n=1 Tax=Prosthecobacter sp. TaxID=1965333 RepID=UPI0019DA33C8|nr:hypothetical protein [Prosthecobacter sp.]MBE2283793.1 hypothetical protein [Prosthecobacter sp.]
MKSLNEVEAIVIQIAVPHLRIVGKFFDALSYWACRHSVALKKVDKLPESTL